GDRDRSCLAPLLPVLVARPRGAGALRGHPQDRSFQRGAVGGGRRAPGGGRAVPGLHARPAAPRVPRGPGHPDRGPLGADDRRDAVGRERHRDRRGRRRRELLGARRGRPPELRRVRRLRHARVLHPRAIPQARGRQDRGPPARRAVRAVAAGGHR
ncbi:MAG: hypothetical protein AVDCRST_MAG85-840, partial [uncultured Solirubrobacteraceae bacterium]